MNRLLTYDEIAEVLGVCRRTVERLVTRNAIPFVQIGKRVMFNRDTVIAKLSRGAK